MDGGGKGGRWYLVVAMVIDGSGQGRRQGGVTCPSSEKNCNVNFLKYIDFFFVIFLPKNQFAVQFPKIIKV